MEILNRIKNILVAPKKEWAIVESENEPHGKVFVSYLLPLALIPAIGSFIGYGLIGTVVVSVAMSAVLAVILIRGLYF
jgi:hypothetical protein